MYRSHPLMRFGNKNQDIKNFEELLPRDVDIIVEPFAGTWAVTRQEYNDPKYKRHINDTDKEFILNTTAKLSYKKDTNVANQFYVEDRKQGSYIRLDYTKCTSHVESSLEDFLHDLRKIISCCFFSFNLYKFSG